MIPLGDSHNFGKRVSLLADGYIHKPRSVLWEWLLLSKDSPFRAELAVLAKKRSLNSPLNAFPSLRFDLSSTGLYEEGKVERLQILPPHPSSIPLTALESIGSAIAFLVWMGIYDLHNENIFFGISVEGRPVFGPIDVECAMDDLYLPSQCHLVPSPGFHLADCGLLKLYSYLAEFPASGSVAAIAHGYLTAIEFLLKEEFQIMSLLTKAAHLAQASTRLILRPTREYYSILKNGTLPETLLAGEAAQLRQKDIPYFFRPLTEKAIYYYSAPGIASEQYIVSDTTLKALTHSRLFANGELMPRKNGELLRKASAIQLIRFLTRMHEPFEETYRDVQILAQEDEMRVSFTGTPLETMRLKFARNVASVESEVK
jgi:hypothetical protein